jgi:hypothetical protein
MTWLAKMGLANLLTWVVYAWIILNGFCYVCVAYWVAEDKYLLGKVDVERRKPEEFPTNPPVTHQRKACSGCSWFGKQECARHEEKGDASPCERYRDKATLESASELQEKLWRVGFK